MKLEDIVSKKENLEKSIVKMIVDFEKDTGMWVQGIGLSIYYSSGSLPPHLLRVVRISVDIDNKEKRDK